MRRTAAAFALATLAVLGSPDMARAQQQEAYTVTAGNTLWDLAERFYGDPFQWRTIWEANEELVDNPDLIYPGQVLRIPDGQGGFMEVRVVPEGSVVPTPPPAAPVERPAVERTIFYPDTTSRAERFFREAEERAVAVALQEALAAPFLTANAQLEVVGELDGYAGEERLRSGQTTAQPFDVLSAATTRRLPVGSKWVSVRRVLRPDLGEIAVPTALFTVVSWRDGVARLHLDVAFDRATDGDALIPAVDYEPIPGVRAGDAMGDLSAEVLGYSRPTTVHGPGDHVFIDLGSSDGVRIGDEFMALFEGEPTRGIAQVVRVDRDGATARIQTMRNAVFLDGIELVRSKKMPAN